MKAARHFGSHLIGLLTAVSLTSCGPVHPCFANCRGQLAATFQPDAASPTTVVRLVPASAWTDTGITVHKTDRLLFSAAGEVTWQTRHLTTTADGDRGEPGWNVGPGGLQGRIGADGRAFDIGARTEPFAGKRAHTPQHPYPPPPIAMPRDGALYLGFKNFTPGSNTGMLEVTIRRAVPVAP